MRGRRAYMEPKKPEITPDQQTIIDTIVPQVIALLDAQGIGLTSETCHEIVRKIAGGVSHEGVAREQAAKDAKRQRHDQALQEWLAANHMTPITADVRAKLGVDYWEMLKGMEIRVIPFVEREVFVDGVLRAWETHQFVRTDLKPLTPDQMRQIRDKLTMTRLDAAEFLEISPYRFDKLRKQHGVQSVDNFKSTISGQIGYLYRTSDIYDLKEKMQ